MKVPCPPFFLQSCSSSDLKVKSQQHLSVTGLVAQPGKGGKSHKISPNVPSTDPEQFLVFLLQSIREFFCTFLTLLLFLWREETCLKPCWSTRMTHLFHVSLQIQKLLIILENPQSCANEISSVWTQLIEKKPAVFTKEINQILKR